MDYKELIRRLDDCGEFDGDLLDDAATAIETLLAEREAAGWISAEDSLPKTEGNYLCAFDDGFIATASWIDSDWELWADSGDVTHWMPLPTPPDRERTER